MSDDTIRYSADWLIGTLQELFGRDSDWPKATCGECAWRGPEWQPRQSDGILLAECRRISWGGEDATGLGVVLLDWPACPAFVRRIACSNTSRNSTTSESS
jgi:hypothetical protein